MRKTKLAAHSPFVHMFKLVTPVVSLWNLTIKEASLTQLYHHIQIGQIDGRAKTETRKSSVEVESQRNLTPNVPSGWPHYFSSAGAWFLPQSLYSSLLSGGVEQYRISIEWIYSPLLFVIPHFSPYLCSSLLASTLNCRFCVQTPERRGMPKTHK